MKVDIVKILATFFCIGYLPYFPGTWGSLAGLGIYFLVRNNLIIYITLVISILLIGFLVCSKAEDKFGRKDASFIVIDEVAAILILLKIVPQNLFFLIIAFFVFRIMDIVKLYPIKKIEKFSGSWGIMLDDLAAGFYTALSIFLIKIFVK